MHEKKGEIIQMQTESGGIHIVRSLIHIGRRSFTHTWTGGLQENVISGRTVEITYNGEDGGQVGLVIVVSERVWSCCTTNVSRDAK